MQDKSKKLISTVLAALIFGLLMVTPFTSNTAVAANPIGAVINVGPRANAYDDPANGIYVSPTGSDATARKIHRNRL